MREQYEDLISYVQEVTGVSRNRAWEVLKEYSDVLKQAVKLGNDVDIEGLVDISFTSTKGYVYKNSVYGFEEQVTDVTKRLGLEEFEVRNILITYLKRIRTRLLDGYHVNIKGVCYMIPEEEDDGVVICSTRTSPVLYKPEVVDFLLLTEKGITLKELGEKDLRFNIRAKESIKYLYEVVTEERKLELPEVQI